MRLFSVNEDNSVLLGLLGCRVEPYLGCEVVSVLEPLRGNLRFWHSTNSAQLYN